VSPFSHINNCTNTIAIMKILNFSEFKLLLEADSSTQAAPAAADPSNPPQAGTSGTAGSSIPPPSPSSGGSSGPTSMPPPPNTSFNSGSELPADPNAPVASAEAEPIRLIFVDQSEPWHTKYSDGGGMKRYQDYELTMDELEQWITSSGLEANHDEIINAVQGTAPLASALYGKFKEAITKKKLGKDRGDIDIEYDSKDHPSTSDLDVVFVKQK